MKFSEMPYQRPDLDAVKQQFADLCARFKAAESYAEARAVFLEEEKLNKHVDTQAQLASVRNTIDTRDTFYDAEMNFCSKIMFLLKAVCHIHSLSAIHKEHHS